MVLDPITTNGPTITVSSSAELNDAYNQLANAGGGTILMEGGDYGTLALNSYTTDGGGTGPVVISSADPGDPAEFSRVVLGDVSNIRIENILVDSTGVERPTWHVDLAIDRSTNIQIVDSVFQHDVGNAGKDADIRGEDMSLIRTSEDILFENNYVDGYFHAIKSSETTNLQVIGNELTNMQGDGFRGGGFEDLLIADNYMHDFYGTDQTLNHSDLIQIWGADSDTLTKNVTITGNILITAEAASQSIFIRNEEFGDAGDPTAGYFENLVITDNLIYNAHRWGVQIADTDGALIEGNTILWNPDAQMMVAGDPRSYLPEIFARNSYNITVQDNIVSNVTVPDGNGNVVGDNRYVTYTDPSDENYVTHHFTNPLEGAGADLRDIYLLEDSPWFGIFGADLGYMPSSTDDGKVLAIISAEASEGEQYEITFDAGYSLDGSGLTSANGSYNYHWTFADGSTASGATVTRLFSEGGTQDVTLEIRLDGLIVAEVERGIDVQTKDIFAFDFEDGVVDISDATPGVTNEGSTVNSHDGKGFLIGDGSEFQIARSSEGLTYAEKFGMAMDLKPTGDEQSGIFLYMHQSMAGWVTPDGHFGFRLSTDEGTYSLTSRDPVFDDGDTHRIGIAFNGNTGQLELFADGESASSTEAWGSTLPPKSWNLIFGNAWDDSMDAIIDNVVMNADPSVAGDLPVIDPPAEDPPAEDPPAEDPPAEDPPAEDPPAEDPPAEDPPAEDPPAEDPPAEDPPAEDPPAEDPPAEDPPAEDPPAEDPPAEEEPRGKPKEAVESDDSGNFLSKIFEMFVKLFGGGGKGNKATEDTTTEEAAATYDTTLADIMPITEMLEDDVVATQEEDDEFTDLAA